MTASVPEPNLHLGASLTAPGTDDLRFRLARCFAGAHSPVAVFTLFELAERLGRLTDESEARGAGLFVVLDLQRIVLYRDGGAAGEPGLSSLVRFLLDGYPLQPFELFAAAERGRPYRLMFDPAVLELATPCLSRLARGEYCVLDLVTGEILYGKLFRHPRGPRLPRLVSASAPPDARLRAVTTDRGLRAGPPPDLRPLVGAAAGIIRRDDLEPDFSSMAFATTLVSWNRGSKREFCYGKSPSPSHARAIARCEAVERFQIAFHPPTIELVRGSYEELAADAIDPRTLFFGRSPECPGDRVPPYDPTAALCWTWAFGPAERRWRLVPAQEVWFNTPELMSEQRYAYSTTSGCAAGASLEEAGVAAALEAIERDAFLTAWYLRRPAREIDLDSCAGDEFQDLRDRFRLAFPRYRAVLFDLTSDVGVPTVGGLAVRERGGGPRVCAAVATHIDPEVACLRAFRDITGFSPDMTPERLLELQARRLAPETVVGPTGHFELYALDESFVAFDYLELGRRPRIAVEEIGAASPVAAQAQLRLDVLLESLDTRLRELGAALYIKDLSHPELAAQGLHTARAVTPGLYPLWFGHGLRRFAVTDRLQRLAQAYTGRGLDRARLQLDPHPLA